MLGCAFVPNAIARKYEKNNKIKKCAFEPQSEPKSPKIYWANLTSQTVVYKFYS